MTTFWLRMPLFFQEVDFCTRKVCCDMFNASSRNGGGVGDAACKYVSAKKCVQLSSP